jgi:hypothetical protein
VLYLNLYLCLTVCAAGHGARLREKVDMEQSVKLVAELISSAVPSKKAFIVGVHLGYTRRSSW